MEIKNKIKELNIMHLLKTGIGSALAILLANRFNLAYSASAGIITLLTIQNTKRETLALAFKRILAFTMAVIIAYLLFTKIGYTTIAFGGFVFIFVGLCNLTGLQDGISMNAVLTTHFLIEKRMDMTFIMNEVFILLIGMGIGIIVNLIMPRHEGRIEEEQRIVEEKMRTTLTCMSNILIGGSDELECNISKITGDFKELDLLLGSLLSKAYEDAGNRLLSVTKYQISYLEMRKLQIVVMKEILDSIQDIHHVLPQSLEVSDYLLRVAEEFHELNNVKDLIRGLEELNEFFKKEKLPTSRNEFENRAILFRILRDLKNFLELKRSFMVKSMENK